MPQPRHTKTSSFLDNLIHWGIIFTAFCSPFILLPDAHTGIKIPQMAFIQVSAAVLLLILSLKSFVSNPKIIRVPFYGPILALSIWSSISLLYAPNKYEGLIPLTHWLGSSLFFFLIVHDCRKTKKRTHLFAALFIAGSCTALIGIGQHLFNISWFPQLAPPAAMFLNRNMASHFIVLTIPLGLFFILNGNKEPRLIWPCFLMTASMIVYLIYTRSRAGWIALTIEIFLIIILLRKAAILQTGNHYWNRSKSVALTVSLVVVFFLINTGPEGFEWNINKIADRAVSITQTGNQHSENESLTSTGLRLIFWANTTAMIKDHFLFGVGIGNFKIIYPLYSQRIAKDPVFSYTTQLYRAHNDFLQAFAELGIIGILLITWLTIKITQISFKALDRCESSQDRLTVIASFVSIAGIAVNACFSFPFQRPIPPFVFMALLAVIGAVYSEIDKTFFTFPGQPRLKIHALIISALLMIIVIRFHYNSIRFDRLAFQMVISEKNHLWNELINQGRTAFEQFPDRVSYLSPLGRAFMAKGMYQQAAQTLRTSLIYYPNSLNDNMNHGIASARIGDYQQAISSYKKVLEIKPDLSKPHYKIGQIYEEQGNLYDALQEYLTAAEIAPDNSRIYFDIGRVQAELKEYRQAANAFQKAVEIDPGFVEAHKNLGRILKNFLNQPETGEAHLKWAFELSPATEGTD
jgi:O-antigen ligase/Flp pilus assembly protein TadD